MEKFKLMKVFDCIDMQDGVREEFYLYAQAGNDCYINYRVNGQGINSVSDWLLDNGCEPNEMVIIRHWW